MDESQKVIRSIPKISTGLNVAIFVRHEVSGLAVAEALFPRHVAKLAKIKLAPCDSIHASPGDLLHIPFRF